MARIKKDITVRFIPNLLSKEGREIKSFEYSRSKTVKDYLQASGFCLIDIRIIVNGIERKDIDTPLNTGDEIVIVPNVTDPITMTAVYYAIVGWSFVFAIAAVAYSVYQAITYQEPKLPSFDTQGQGMDEASPSHSWNGARTVRQSGGSVPIIYGIYLVGGTIINEHITTDGDKNYLNSLIAICEGEIKSATLSRINRNPAENYTNYTTVTRMGTNDQSVIPNFEDLHSLVAVNVELVKDAAYVYTTAKSDVEAFEIRFNMPSGLWAQGGSGGVSSWSVTYQVEYKLHGDANYTDLGTTTVTEKSRSEVRRIFRKDGLTAGQYDIRITRTSDDSDLEHNGDLFLQSVDEINTDDLEYPNTALISIKTLAIEQLANESPDYEIMVEGRLVLIPQVMNGAVEVDWEDYYWDPEEEAYRLFSDDTILTWDGTTYVEAFSANPIWCIYDLSINTRYGIGNHITTSDNDLDYLLEMSQYCEEKVPDGEGGYEKRFRMDVCIDSPQKALDLITQLCSIFRGFPFYSDQGKVRFCIDKPDTPVQLFGMGNIVKNSFSQAWGSRRDIPNVVQVQFDNQDNYYQQDLVSIADEEALTAGEKPRTKQVRYYGTKLSYALRHGRNVLKTTKYISETVVFKGGSGALVRQCGELIDVAHDVPQWGFSGRVKAGSTTTKVALDREVTVEAGKSYAIRVDFSDGTYEEQVVTSSVGLYTEIDTAEFSKEPAEWDSYSFGELTKIVKPFRITGIKRPRMGETEIEAMEYSADIYDDSSIDVPQKRISSLSMDIPNVESLRLTEGLIKSKDGTIQNVIDVWFAKPYMTNYVRRISKVKIFLSDNAGDSWESVGESYGSNFSIIKVLTDGVTYTVAAVSVTDDGQENAISSSPQDDIQLVGKSAPPADITTFLVNQNRDRLYFGWTHVTDVDLAGYEIRYGDSWEAGFAVVSGVKNNSHIEMNFKEGNAQSFWIKAIDRSGNFSTTAKEAVVTIDNIPFTNIIESYAEQTAWAGTKTDLSKVGDNLEIDAGHLSGTYVTPIRDVGYVATFKIGVNSVVVDASEEGVWNEEPVDGKWSDLSLTDRWSGQELTGAATFEIKTSEDNITWSDYISYQPGDYKCRYFQLRMTLTRENTAKTIQCSEFNYYADLPDVDEVQDGEVTVAANGCDITFAKTFHEAPALNVTILTGDGYVWKASSLSTTGVTIKLYDLSGTLKTGTFRIGIHGV
jgi:predicted phage tail protein/molybdopterin converting factor small subunit